ncbi:NUDIX domain-containing protein [Candidatus Woesearchaeota archaeon]|nr:NUDIX domain-containing protein [Candidatus Woesearchaeota archaeon]
MTNKKGLIIGKFDVVHKGHEDMLRKVSEHEGIDKVITAITTNKKNIFSWEERKIMLEHVTKKLSKPFLFYNVPDINNPPVYAEHVRRIIQVPSLDQIILFTGNPQTAHCFKGKCEIQFIKTRYPFSSTRILEMIGTNDDNWASQVPEITKSIISTNNGVKRIKDYFTKCEDFKRKPYLTTDIIMEYQKGIVLIERKNPPYGWALPGGFQELGITTKQNAIKEAKEETGLNFEIEGILGLYDDPERDVRAHAITIVYYGKGSGKLKADDDAKNAGVFKYDQTPWGQLAFDHAKIIKDYYDMKNEINNEMKKKA